jgi:LmbE family N-acetylglucosaminyl deacetylase
MTQADGTTARVFLAVQAHPDDVDITSGGAVARWVAEGHEVHYLSITSGNKGTHDRSMSPEQLTEIREAEQMEAARRLGVGSVTFLRRNDGEVESNLSLRREICLSIRKVRANALVTFDPWRPYQMHPDHRATGITALDAIIAARDHLFFPEQLRDGIDISRVHDIYLFGSGEPDTWIDISDTIERKIYAIAAHVSQNRGSFEDRAERHRARAREIGQQHGHTCAEAFKFLHLN